MKTVLDYTSGMHHSYFVHFGSFPEMLVVAWKMKFRLAGAYYDGKICDVEILPFTLYCQLYSRYYNLFCHQDCSSGIHHSCSVRLASLPEMLAVSWKMEFRSADAYYDWKVCNVDLLSLTPYCQFYCTLVSR